MHTHTHAQRNTRAKNENICQIKWIFRFYSHSFASFVISWKMCDFCFCYSFSGILQSISDFQTKNDGRFHWRKHIYWVTNDLTSKTINEINYDSSGTNNTKPIENKWLHSYFNAINMDELKRFILMPMMKCAICLPIRFVFNFSQNGILFYY